MVFIPFCIELVFYDHYFDLLTYIGARKSRLSSFKDSIAARSLSSADIAAEWASYTGRERVLLRKRRTKLKLEQFHIITQVGQGGYGEVYLARRKDSGEVVALKKMRKRTLLKMDEVGFSPSALLIGFCTNLASILVPSDSTCVDRARYSGFDQQSLARQASLRFSRSNPCVSRHGTFLAALLSCLSD